MVKKKAEAVKTRKGELLPGGWRKRGKPPTYPLATMREDEPFDTDIKPGETEQQALKRLRTSTSTWRLKHHSPRKFSVRIVTDDAGKRVVRVWMQEGVPPVRRIKGGNSFFDN